MKTMYPLSGLALIIRHFQTISNVYPPDNYDLAIFFDLAPRFSSQPPIASGDSARFQRASKSARQSTGGGRYDIINCGRMRVMNIWVNTIMLSHFRMYPKQDRFIARWQVGAAQGTSYALNS
ncbi:MAG: hypothetical protein QGF90_11340, partial [Gammaproteobacteria bacterium]|nr:hypothetical protein [Gammaproteobacteria bacterium]